MRIIFTIIVILMVSTYAFAEGLGTLIEVARAQGEIAKDAKRETKNFESVKEAVATGELKKGMTGDYILKQYGAPVIKFDKKVNEKETWIYKSAKASFFEGEKIYLIFDDSGVLEEIKTVVLAPEKEE